MTTVVIGEALVDLAWRAGCAHIVPHPGGSPANVAVGLRRLGQPATLMTCWGDDLPGELVRAYLDSIGVEVHCRPSASSRTTIALAYLDDTTGSAHYDFLAAWDPLDIPLPPQTTLIHTGSLAAVVEPGATRVVETCHAHRSHPGRAVSVSVDLNVRPAVLPDRDAYRTRAERLVAAADLVKASDEDLAWLYPDLTPEAAARALLAHGPRLAVITRGAQGATALTEHHQLTVPAPPTHVVDTIGAGDAFQACLLDTLLQPDGTVHIPGTPAELERALRRCVTADALTCARAGAQPPTSEEIAAALAAEDSSLAPAMR
ncbi:carbohydrate kinase family protein [Streptomyces swartbergensis]|uniref:Carbohydrate kinase n=1 Tax=Streptomyces swartbergensis TaxID=487165 RepID=A0A243RDG5_9ACTN|nr:carbohydrate kinase [Streptomyces swartbergensis]OUC92770.1 carbohydrate kinase [Streptomyces swartbergensis]